MTATKPDVDLTDGDFYADRPAAREAYRWMRANEPVFRDRNGLAVATCPLFEPGIYCASASATDSMSARAASRVTPGFSRPITCR